ncbi:hypothetical protein [Streptomyces sp. NPDC005955]|uniref:hypothetical protein n=1 Tax=Streptomyces sp. NPDC005955 TaxID=3364738 RepID=UPI00369D0A4F
MTATRAGAVGGADRPPSGPDPDRFARSARSSAGRSPGRTRLLGALLVAGGLAAALACYAAFALWLPSDDARYRDFTAAEPCPGAAAARGSQDCLRTLARTVTDTEVTTQGKGSVYEATLRGDGRSGSEVVAFGDPGPLLERLRPGDRVTATVWRGDVIALDRDGVRQGTSVEPRDELQMTAAIGTFAGLLAALGLWFGAVRLARPDRPEPFVWRGYGGPLFYTVVVLCAVVGLLTLWWEFPWWLVPAAVVPFVAYTARAFHQYRLRVPVTDAV